MERSRRSRRSGIERRCGSTRDSRFTKMEEAKRTFTDEKQLQRISRLIDLDEISSFFIFRTFQGFRSELTC